MCRQPSRFAIELRRSEVTGLPLPGTSGRGEKWERKGKKKNIRAIVNQSINILFYVCSHRGDIRQKQKHIIIIYTNFPTGL